MNLRGRLQTLLGLPSGLWQLLVCHWPGPTGDRLRYRHWKRRLRRLGEGTRIDAGVHIQSPQHVSIGSDCWIDRGVVILAGPPGGGRLTHEKKNPDFELDPGEVRIGDHTHVAPYCVLSGIGGIDIGSYCGVASHSAVYSFSHNYRNAGDPDDRRQFAFTPRARPDQQSMIVGPVVIRDYCAVGLNSVLLPGTTLERGTWLACGAVVAGRYGPQAVVRSDATPVVKDVSELRIVE